MKTLLSFIIVLASFSTAFSYQITATVILENNTEKTTLSGVFYITETNQSFPVNSLNDFTVELPEKGKYNFKFYSEEVNAFTNYSVRITEQKTTITIRLENKTEDSISNATADISSFSTKQVEEGIAMGTINFIVHGLVAPDPKAIKLFKTAYGVGFTSENCVVDPMSYKIALNTNKRIEDYLTSKFGNDWKIMIPAHPFGLQSNTL